MAIGMTHAALAQMLGREVEEIHLTVAKAVVMGMDLATLANAIGVPESELKDLTETQDYKDVRLLVGAEHVKSKVESDSGWDGIENTAVTKLFKRVQLENDTETLLKIAAVANRATRRMTPPKENPLDPSQVGARIPLTLTRRFTERLNGSGQVVERSEIQQISVLNGSAVNPSFKEVSQALDTPRDRPSFMSEGTAIPINPVDDVFDINELTSLAESLKKQ